MRVLTHTLRTGAGAGTPTGHTQHRPRVAGSVRLTARRVRVALVAVEIPKVGLVMENARLVRWLKNVGDVVQEGEPLLELEMEKSTVEIESPHSGRLVELVLQVDQEARVGDRVAWLESDGDGAAAASGPVATADPAATASPAAAAGRVAAASP